MLVPVCRPSGARRAVRWRRLPPLHSRTPAPWCRRALSLADILRAGLITMAVQFNANAPAQSVYTPLAPSSVPLSTAAGPSCPFFSSFISVHRLTHLASLFVSALCLLSTGYMGIRCFYEGLFDFLSPNGISTFAMALLMIFSIFTGLGGNSGFTAAVNATAKSFPDSSVRQPVSCSFLCSLE